MSDKEVILQALKEQDKGFAVVVDLDGTKNPPAASRSAIENRASGLATLDSPIPTGGEECVFVRSLETGQMMAVWLDELRVAQPKLM